MLIILRANKLTSNMRSDVGQYNMLTKKMELWINSSRLVNGETDITIPDFNLPDSVEKIHLIDYASDAVLAIPLDVFKASKSDSGDYVFNYSEWRNKYRRLI